MSKPMHARAPLAYTIDEAAEAIGSSRSVLLGFINAGDLTTKWLGGKRIIAASELQEFVDALPLSKPGVN